MALRNYLATEIALDHADGLLSRRDALHKLGLLGLSTVAASTLLASCSSEAPPAAAPGTAAPSAAAAPNSPAATPTAPPDYDVAAARARSEDVTFPGGTGTMSGAWAAAESPKGAVLVVHENRGLTDHIRAVAGRLAGDGYSALAPDLLSRAGGTGGVPDATAALGAISTEDLVADLRSSLAELRTARTASSSIRARGRSVLRAALLPARSADHGPATAIVEGPSSRPRAVRASRDDRFRARRRATPLRRRRPSRGRGPAGSARRDRRPGRAWGPRWPAGAGVSPAAP